MSGLASEQSLMIAESAAAFTADNGGSERARQLLNGTAGTFDASCWRGLAELGWFGIGVPESSGGIDLGPHAACLVAEEAGRSLLMPPLTMAMAAANLLSSQSESSLVKELGALVGGNQHIGLALATSGGWSRPIEVQLIPDGDLAQSTIVGIGDGEQFDARLIARDTEGVTFSAEQCVDGSWLGSAAISMATWANAPRVASGAEGRANWNSAINLLRIADVAYLCGLMAAALTMSLDYLRLRHQFGVPIGSFQALQHRAADCHIHVAAARALLYESVRAFGTSRETWSVAACVSRATEAALHVTKENVQFHGAIGFAEEHDAGLYLRRAMVVSARHTADALRILRAGANGSVV